MEIILDKLRLTVLDWKKARQLETNWERSGSIVIDCDWLR